MLDLGTLQDQIIGSGTGTFDLSDSTLVLTLGSGFDYSEKYTLFSGFSGGDNLNLIITGYDSTGYSATLGDDGVLSFTAVPEPSSIAFLLMGGLGLFAAAKRVKSRC